MQRHWGRRCANIVQGTLQRRGHASLPPPPSNDLIKVTTLREYWDHWLHTYFVGAHVQLTKLPSTVALDLSTDTCLHTLPENIFQNSRELVELILPSSITEIKTNALRGCTSLRLLDMRSLTGLTRLPDDFLSGCSSLEEVVLPHRSHTSVPTS